MRLSDIATTNIGLTYHPEDIAEDGTIVVRSSNIINSKMDYADLVKVRCPIRQNEYLNNNDIVICARNGSKALVGKCAIYEGESGKVAFGAFMAVLRTPFYRYVFCYLHTNAFRRYFHSDDSKQINQVTQNILKEALIPIPPLAEQHRIVARIEQAFSALDTIDALQAKYADNLAVLKSKLIDAAIQGKLTEQLPEDGTAEELYRQIQAEKQALIKAGKIKKEKPLPEIADNEVPFEIPANWKWVRVGSVAEVAGGTTPKSSEIHTKGTIPYFKVSDMNTAGNETHMIHASNFISKGYTGRIFPVGTTIFPKNGGAALTNKRRILVVPSAVDLNTGGCTSVLFEMTEWIRLFMDTIDFGKMDTGSNIPTVNATNLKNQYLPLPPLAEQKRIVERVTELLAVCNQFRNVQ